jgi:hypothetical protein
MKKLFKRVLIIILAVFVAVQVPFIYRRYKFSQLAENIAKADANRVVREDPGFTEYKGVIHAHTNLGGHSTGSFDEIIAAAQSNDLDFVIMTEHWSDTFDTAALTLNGKYGKTLFVGGNEIDTADGDRFLMVPGDQQAAGLRKIPTSEVIAKFHGGDGTWRLALVTYPEKFNSWDSEFDGVEVFSVHTAAKKANPFTALFDLLWSYPAYPKLTLTSYFRRPDENLAKFDRVSADRAISLFAGTDAHSNIGFHLFGDDAGNKLINFKIDPYETTFGLARFYILQPKGWALTRDNLLRALQFGQGFIGFDALGDPSGFRFAVTDETGVRISSMGEDLVNRPGLKLAAFAPLPARFVVFKNGDRIFESQVTTEISIESKGIGAYRVEVYRDQLGPPFDEMPWIISNPVHVREQIPGSN